MNNPCAGITWRSGYGYGGLSWRWRERRYRRRHGAWTHPTTTHGAPDGGFVLHLWALKLMVERRPPR